MAFQGFPMRSGNTSSVYLNCKAPQVLSEIHTIVEDCRNVQYHYTSPMAPQKVFIPSEQHFNATKNEYLSRPQATVHAITRPPLPRPSHGYYNPQMVNMEHHQVIPSHTRRPNEGSNSSSTKIMNSSEAAKLYGGYVITEYRNRK